MLNDARVASLGFFKDKVCTTRVNKENKFKIKFQVLLKFTQILPDYLLAFRMQPTYSAISREGRRAFFHNIFSLNFVASVRV